MEKDVRLNLSRAACLLLLVVVGACSRPAPSLPPDRMSTDAVMDGNSLKFLPADLTRNCTEIEQGLAENAMRMGQIESRIKANRADNQALGYISGVLFPPLVLAAEHNEAEKKELDSLQKKRDTLIALRAHKRCDAVKNTDAPHASSLR